ncbi:hypothetical protein J4573_14550 [Actinomadura barringtoniae]|uniref:Uncharacterized protein n=1 Tax=Actinomadura barringtoniae TaxID=1427535 RepID=A0A939PA33_9ACTN|nr:hypothetical protein [Actinomadura barringtoniae]MBO2448322.1 hypothetical protein [Actinomadura barringtoniae]
MTGRMRHLAAALTGLGLGLAAVGPGLAPGFVLSYDMVFVPDPTFSRMTFGLTGVMPRHVPSDAFVTALSTVMPADLAQKLILLAIFVMACSAAASLVPSQRLIPRLAAGVCYAWNPFVAERLLLGQWALLLGYAALPWVVAAAMKGDGRRLVIALIPAATGGFAALAVSGLTAVVITLCGPRRADALKVIGAVGALSLPWLVPAFLRPGGVPGDGAAVETFAARADTPFGALGSLFTLGGVWNGETVPSGYGTPVVAVLWLLVVVGALIAYGKYGRDRALPIAAAVGFAIAALGTVPGLLKGLIDIWSGFSVVRDGQQFVAPLAVLVAVGLGLAADRLIEARLGFVAACAVAVPVILLPTLAWGAAGALRAVDYPDDWARARKIIAADSVPGDVAVAPWAAYRSYPWNHGRRVLDPLQRYLPRRVIINDAVTVGTTTVAAEDPRAVALDPIMRAPTAEALAHEGIRYVAVDAGDAAVPGAEEAYRGRDLVLYRISGTSAVPEKKVPVAPVVTAWIVAVAVIFWSFLASGPTLVPQLLGRNSSRRRTP